MNGCSARKRTIDEWRDLTDGDTDAQSREGAVDHLGQGTVTQQQDPEEDQGHLLAPRAVRNPVPSHSTHKYLFLLLVVSTHTHRQEYALSQ